MSDTPKTDAALKEYVDSLGWGTYPDNLIKLCRDLERELAEAEERIQRLIEDAI